MSTSRRRGGSSGRPGDVAGVISRIHVENFMCHSNLTIDLIDNVNFITGQNGSGKSAILTALCVAFGIRARGTQRASTMKDFIKSGSSYALVVVEMKNEGPDAFRPDVFGKQIVIERRITSSSTNTVLKDDQGRKVAAKKEDLNEIVDHFNIDVENPCVIMSQDKSRDFLSGGNDKEKFKFFYKATLLQQVSELLDTNCKNIEACQVYLKANEETFRPFEQELAKLDEEIKRAERVDEMAQEVTALRKKVVWSHVYDADRQVETEKLALQRFRDRIPRCQSEIDKFRTALEEKKQEQSEKKATVSELVARTDKAKGIQNQLYRELTEVARERAGLEESIQGKLRSLEAKRGKKRSLRQHAREIQESFVQSTQAEELERDESIKALLAEINQQKIEVRSLQEEEDQLSGNLRGISERATELSKEVEDKRAKLNDLHGYLRRLQNQQTNKLSAFGGDNVIRLMRKIEEQRHSFSSPPLGPIGAHLALAGGDTWALAVEVAVGKLFNAFVVNNHKDMLALRKLARECQYGNLHIVIYDFEHPELQLPEALLPDRRLVTVLSVLRTEDATIRNVLIDQGGVERQVLVQDYDEGSGVVFQRRQPNVKEAFTKDGSRMFSRAGSETTLPRDRNIRGGRLDSGVERRICQTEGEISQIREEISRLECLRNEVDQSSRQLKCEIDRVRSKLAEKSRAVSRSEFRLRDMKRQTEQIATAALPNTEELENEIKDVEAEEQKLERLIEGLRAQLVDIQAKHELAKTKHDDHCDSTKDDAETLRTSADALQNLDEELNSIAASIDHYTKLMNEKVLPQLRDQEAKVKQSEDQREDLRNKASQVCSDEELETLGGVRGSTQKLDAELQRLQAQVNNERRNVIPVEQLQRNKLRVEKRIFKKKHVHMQLKQKIDTMWSIYEKRRDKFEQNSAYLKRQMMWQFNVHLRKKGFSGHLKIDYQAKTLKLEILMPQDASNTAVSDTRALSGGERSFSTVCFALALHEMTEAPFRAMDEFDVFMDSVARRISLDTLVDFALQQGSQWIFITPSDISTVKDHPRLKKQQMSAPRP